jgi:hypothetical protein
VNLDYSYSFIYLAGVDLKDKNIILNTRLPKPYFADDGYYWFILLLAEEECQLLPPHLRGRLEGVLN